jgi:hypothetical protein
MKTKIPKLIEVTIAGEYTNFNDFFESNKTKIYDGIIYCFDLLSNSKRKTIKYLVSATTISQQTDSETVVVEFKTEFFFKKSESSLLIDYILEHYEEIEEYEKCSKIINLHKRLTNSEKPPILELTNV